MYSLQDLFTLCLDNCVGGSCVSGFQEATAHPTVTTSSDERPLFSSED